MCVACLEAEGEEDNNKKKSPQHSVLRVFSLPVHSRSRSLCVVAVQEGRRAMAVRAVFNRLATRLGLGTWEGEWE